MVRITSLDGRAWVQFCHLTDKQTKDRGCLPRGTVMAGIPALPGLGPVNCRNGPWGAF